ncbi:MAG TPA: hypothetical protein VHW92_01025 [Mycobacteriales bacterium]|jgi:hypothetical protein|nr:hypothetical protein [Mycobacteriales bacterium]
MSTLRAATLLRVATVAAVGALALSPVVGAHATTQVSSDKQPTAKLAFYANGTQTRLLSVTLKGNRAKARTLVTAASPVWWRTFYLTPTSAAGRWVVGSLSGDQTDTDDPPRMFAYNRVTRSLRWLAPRSRTYRSPVVDAEKVPEVFFVSGATVRKVSTRGTHNSKVFSAPKGWNITALTVAGTAAPYVALTHNTGLTPATATTYVVQLAPTAAVTVIPRTPGSVTALALSPNTKTLAVSRTKQDGDSVLSLQAEAHGGVSTALPAVGTTDQMSWDSTGDTLAVDPQQWGGWTLVTVSTGATSYPKAVQPYGGGIFAP